MATLSILFQGIFDRINTFSDSALKDIVILKDDAPELESAINQALGEQGMLILIGQPNEENTGDVKMGKANMKVTCEIAVGENPLLWRDETEQTLGQKTCLDAAEFVISKLQGWEIAGFAKLRVSSSRHVPDKNRQLRQINIETNRIIQQTT